MRSSIWRSRARAGADAGQRNGGMPYTRGTEARQPVKVTLERLPESRVQLEIEVEPDRLERSLDAAYKRLVPKLRVPGFRPGKAPRPVVERMLGREELIREALESLLPDVYREAVEGEDVDAIAPPEIEVLETEPVRFKATVPVRPTITLGDYRAIRLDPETVEVTDEMFAEQMALIRRRFATIAPVERGAQWGDILTADIMGTVDGAPLVQDEDVEFQLNEGQRLLLPGLAEEFLGMEAESEKAVELPVPDDFPGQARGGTASLTLALKAVKEEELPEEDDDLARQVNADEFETIDQLRERVRADLLETLQRRADEAYRLQAVDELVERSGVEYPAVLLDREVDELIRETHGSDARAFQAHLAQVGQTPAEFRESYREPAAHRLRRSLVLSEFGQAEGVGVSEEEVAERREEMLKPLGENAAAMRNVFESERGAAGIRQDLLTNKTLDRLRAIAAGEVADDGEAADDAEAASEPVVAADAADDADAGEAEPASEPAADADAAPEPEASNEEHAE